MTQLTIKDLDESVRRRLDEFARAEGISVEQAVRNILQAAVGKSTDQPPKLGSRIAKRFSKLDYRGEIKELRGQSADPVVFD